MTGRKPSSHTFSLFWLAWCVGSASGQDWAKTSEWKADPEAVKKLGAAVEFQGYSIKVPKGYLQNAGPPSNPARSKVVVWAGPARTNAPQALLSINLVAVPASEQQRIKATPVEQMAQASIAKLKGRRTNWKQEGPEKSYINGIEFARIKWSGTSPEDNTNVQGVVYVGRDGARVLGLSISDVDPDLDMAIKVGEAAILSFQKAGQAAVPEIAPEKPAPAPWQADAGALENLALPFTFEGYSIRVPKDFTKEKPTVDGPFRTQRWTGPARGNNSRTMIGLAFATPPAKELAAGGKLTVEQVAEPLIQGFGAGVPGWKQEPTENGSINGMDFVRVRWSSPAARGSIYVAWDGKKAI